MKKNLPLFLLLIFLIVVNGFFLFNYLGKPGLNRPIEQRGPGDFIVKVLQFDDSQMDKMHLIMRKHNQRMRAINNDLKEVKDALFAKISEDSLSTQIIDSITNEIGFLEKEREMVTFLHLRDIQSICNEKQKERFNKIVYDALSKNRPPGQNRPPPRN